MNQKNTNTIVSIMNVLFWMLFIGLCIEAGAIIFNYAFSLFINEKATFNLYNGLNLNKLHIENKMKYHFLMETYCIVSIMKAWTVYQIVRLFSLFKIEELFNETATTLVFNTSKWFLYSGIAAAIGNELSKKIEKNYQEVAIDWHSKELIFIAGLTFLIHLILKKGAEIQEENNLTV